MPSKRDGEGLQTYGGEGERGPRSVAGVRVIEDLETAVKVIDEVMGKWHAYYASQAGALEGVGLVAIVDGRVAGSAIGYLVDASPPLGVVYYVAVREEFRGLMLGRILILSLEEVLDSARLYVATMQSGNKRSIRTFKSLCYKIYTWRELEEADEDLAEYIYRSTCSYEDDIVAVKGVLEGAKPSRGALEEARRIWEETCYKPWLLWRRRRAI